MTAPVLRSQLRCPSCGHEELLDMPTDACVFFDPCAACGVMLRPNAGDCCVFCSFGSVPCPPVQEGTTCCRDAPAAVTDDAAEPMPLTPLGRRGCA